MVDLYPKSGMILDIIEYAQNILEYARNVLGWKDAQHAEYDPYASVLFVTPLSRSLVGMTMNVQLEGQSVAATAYGATEAGTAARSGDI